jgi:aminoglycoside phosphotransferase (APT) family kinase protein
VTTEQLIGRLFSTHRLRQSSDEQFYITRHRPQSSIRLLRIEEHRLQKEADALCALSGENEVGIPRLIEYQHKTSQRRGPHLISGPFKGAILSEVALRLSSAERASIDRSLGQHLRSLSRVKGPKTFGPIRSGATASSGRSSWARYFAKLVYSILEDGEDALVTLPSDMIRMLVQRHHASLDMVTQPKLTLLELTPEDNVVVDTLKMRVAGVLDYSTAVWGDPLLADCFIQPKQLLEGYGDMLGSDVHAHIRQWL